MIYFAYAILATLILFYFFHQKKNKISDLTAHESISTQLESLVSRLNKALEIAPFIKDKLIIDWLESSLKILQPLIERLHQKSSLKNLSQDDQDMELETLKKMFHTYEDRINIFFKAVEKKILGLEYETLFENCKSKTSMLRGCFFCSRPFSLSQPREAKIKLDHKPLRVYSCESCFQELHVSGKVKILYLIIQNQPKHWSLVDDYLPESANWDININRDKKKHAELKIIYSEPTAES